MLKKLLFVVFVSLSLGQLGAFSKTEGLNIYLYDLAVFAFTSIGLAYFIIKGQFKITRAALFFLIFILVAVVSLIPSIVILSTTSFLTASFYLVRLFVYLLAGLIVHNMLLAQLISRKQLYNYVLFSAVLLVFGGLVQLILLPDISVLDSSMGWDPHKNRMVSALLDPNFLGGFIVLCLTILIDKVVGKKERLTLPEKVLFFTLFVSLILTFSRSSWLMFATVIFIYGIVKSRLLLFLCIFVAFMAYFAVPRIQTRLSGITDPADSASFRIISWKNAWEVFQDHPVLGVGFNTYRYIQEEYGFIDSNSLNANSGAGADSSILLVLATTGILGALVFVSSFVVLFKENNSLFTFTLISALFVHSLFVNSLFYPQILFVWSLMLIGCSTSSFSRKLLL